MPQRAVLKKGVIFSLDALLALIIAALLISVAMTNLTQKPVQFGEQAKYSMSMSALAALEKSHTLKQAAQQLSSAALQDFVDAMPSQLCANITIYSSSSQNLLSAKKSGCTTSDRVTKTKRVFADRAGIYYAEMEAWYE